MPVSNRALAVLEFVGPDGASEPTAEAFLAAALCNDARLIGRRIAGDPIDAALLRWVQAYGCDVSLIRAPHPRIDASSSDRRRTVTCRFDGILREYGCGTPEAIGDSLRGGGYPLSMAEAIEAAPFEQWIVLAGGPLGCPLAALGLLRLRDVSLAPAPEIEMTYTSSNVT